MADKNDNTEAIQQTVAGRAQERDVTPLLRTDLLLIRGSSSVTLTTLGDGHAMPSIFAVTPAASTKLPKLMDTLFTGLGTTSCVRKAKLPHGMCRAFGPSRGVRSFRVIVFLVDTHVEIEKGFSPAESMRSQKLSRYTFDMFWSPQKGAPIEYANQNSEKH